MATGDNPHLACPFTDCGSSDAFNWNDDGFGQCHSCSRAYPSKGMSETYDWVQQEYPLKERKKPMEIPVTGSTYNNIRSIDADVCEMYGIQLQTGHGVHDIERVKSLSLANETFDVKSLESILDLLTELPLFK